MNKRDTEGYGVLDPRAGETRFVESIRTPAADLAEVVKQYWSAQWDLRGRDPYPIHILAPPSVNLVVEQQRSWIQGVVRGKFTYVLTGSGCLFGVSFQPAGFHAFAGSRVLDLTDRMAAVDDVFGHDGRALVDRLQDLDDDGDKIDLVEGFLRCRVTPSDPNVSVINRIVDQIMSDRTLTRVDHITRRTGLGKRTLQRLFSEYIGVNPKWVIQRFRLQEAAAQLDQGTAVDLAALALDLGYSDQAHLSRDFKAVVGRAPSEYARGTARR